MSSRKRFIGKHGDLLEWALAPLAALAVAAPLMWLVWLLALHLPDFLRLALQGRR
jgi:hypothetical protein